MHIARKYILSNDVQACTLFDSTLFNSSSVSFLKLDSPSKAQQTAACLEKEVAQNVLSLMACVFYSFSETSIGKILVPSETYKTLLLHA